MNIVERETVIVNTIKDVKCDICTLSCKDMATGLIEKATLQAHWGYGSRKDCEQWDVDLCEACTDRFSVWVSSQGGKIRITNPVLESMV